MSQKTTEEWINEAHKIHGNKYDYSKSRYVNWKTKICIICPEHGEFWQDPSSHLRGCSCPRCSKSSAGLTIEERKQNFIEKAIEIHGDKYDYSKVEYKNKRFKVCIICPEHGEFWQSPERHLQNGCSKCLQKNEIKKIHDKNHIIFIEKAIEIHGDKYDYSKVEYVNNSTKVCIICPEHGEFWQTPEKHLHSKGCPICKNMKYLNEGCSDKLNKLKIKYPQFDFQKAKYINCNTPLICICPIHGEFSITPNSLNKGYGCHKCGKTNKKTTQDFIEKAKKIHGDKYDYSKVEYINSHTKVCVICPEHGEFWIRPNSHLNKQGCAKCGKKIGKHKDKYAFLFIENAHKVHGDKYDYSKVEYINNREPVCIICPEHGEFWQVPSYHTSGNGCPKCNMSWLERDIMIFLEKNNYNYEYQKHFLWLGRQSLDFYLPDYNIAIECQGEQHFRPIKHFGGLNKFKKTQIRDTHKKQLCENNNIKLLYYSTKEFEDYAYYEVIDLFNKIKKIKEDN